MVDTPGLRDPTSGYWSFISMAIVVLFVFYIAGRGELGAWLAILVPAPPIAPKAVGAGQAPGGTDTAPTQYGVDQGGTPFSENTLKPGQKTPLKFPTSPFPGLF